MDKIDELIDKVQQGSKFFAIPQMGEIALACRNRGKLKSFIETGTLGGATSCWASQHFDYVYTIEKHAGFQRGNVKRLGHIPNIRFITGDSRTALAPILTQVDAPSLLWLDAHFVGDYEYGRKVKDECPLREELTAIVVSGEPHFVFIDDAHFFTGQTNLELDISQWPDLDEIKSILSEWHVVLVKEWNVILCIPKEYKQVLGVIRNMRRK